MLLISHRGNIRGPKPALENSPEYILEALSSPKKYNVEIDVWVKDKCIYLGHDEPQYHIDVNFLLENKHELWCHAKNYEALKTLRALDMHTFWHQHDDYTITSAGYIWVYPGKTLIPGCIAVKPNINDDLKLCSGVCSDYIESF